MSLRIYVQGVFSDSGRRPMQAMLSRVTPAQARAKVLLRPPCGCCANAKRVAMAIEQLVVADLTTSTNP